MSVRGRRIWEDENECGFAPSTSSQESQSKKATQQAHDETNNLPDIAASMAGTRSLFRCDFTTYPEPPEDWAALTASSPVWTVRNTIGSMPPLSRRILATSNPLNRPMEIS